MRRWWIPPALAVVLWAAVLPFPLLIDTGTFAFVAERWSEGDALYAEIADNKPPATFAVWRVALAIVGRAKPHVAIELAMQALALAALMLYARRAYDDDLALRAGVLWVVSVFAVQMPDTIAESETLCLPLIVIAMWLGSQEMNRKLRPAFLLGVVAGTMFAIKIVPVLIPFAIAAWIAWKQRALRVVVEVAVGFAVALAPWIVWGVWTGGLDEFLALHRGWQSPTAASWLWRPVMLLVGPLYLIPAGILAVLALVRLRRSLLPNDQIALAALAGALLSVVLQGKFFVYHFLLALPPLVILGARWWAIVRLEPGARPIAGVVLAAILVGGPIARRGDKWLAFARVAVGAESRTEYDARFRILVPAASGVATHAGEPTSATSPRVQSTSERSERGVAGEEGRRPTERSLVSPTAGILADPVADASLAAALPEESRVLLWGLAPQVLFRARAISATRFPHYLPYACRGCNPAFRVEMMREIIASPPDRVVVQRDLVNPIDIGSLQRADEILAQFPELDAFLSSRYALASTHGGFALYVPR